jgi:hypothetical protein
MVVQAIDMSCYKMLPLIQNNASKGWIYNEDSIQADLNAKLSKLKNATSNRRLKPSIIRPCYQKCPITLRNMPMIDRVM